MEERAALVVHCLFLCWLGKSQVEAAVNEENGLAENKVGSPI